MSATCTSLSMGRSANMPRVQIAKAAAASKTGRTLLARISPFCMRADARSPHSMKTMLRYRSYAMLALRLDASLGACKSRPPSGVRWRRGRLDSTQARRHRRRNDRRGKERDSAAAHRRDAQGVTADTWRHVRALYANFAGAPLWLDSEWPLDRSRQRARERPRVRGQRRHSRRQLSD